MSGELKEEMITKEDDEDLKMMESGNENDNIDPIKNDDDDLSDDEVKFNRNNEKSSELPDSPLDIHGTTSLETGKQLQMKSEYFNRDQGKMFIGGLNWDTDEISLTKYFEKFGEILELNIMRDNGKSRGFGFLTFKDSSAVDEVLKSHQHILDGKVIDPKRAIPKEEQDKTGKIFVGGIAPNVTEDEFDEFFSKFGNVIDAQLMIDKDSKKSRGFGFVTYDSFEAVLNVTKNHHYLELKGKKVEIKKAEPRGQQLYSYGSGNNSGNSSGKLSNNQRLFRFSNYNINNNNNNSSKMNYGRYSNYTIAKNNNINPKFNKSDWNQWQQHPHQQFWMQMSYPAPPIPPPGVHPMIPQTSAIPFPGQNPATRNASMLMSNANNPAATGFIPGTTGASNANSPYMMMAMPRNVHDFSNEGYQTYNNNNNNDIYSSYGAGGFTPHEDYNNYNERNDYTRYYNVDE